jgi:hypothetical protein
VIHGGPAVLAFDLLDAVDLSRIEEDALGEGGLARVDVGADSDVANVAQSIHDTALIKAPVSPRIR